MSEQGREGATPAATAPISDPWAKGAASVEGAAEAHSNDWPSQRAAWYGVALVCAVTIFGNLDRGIMSLLIGSIKRDTGFSDTQLSLLLGLAYSISYMGLGLPMARLSDVKRRSVILPGALAVWSLGTAFCGIAQNFVQFFLARMVIGGGECVKAPASASLIPDLIRRRHLPRAFGLYNLSVSLGEALSLALGGALLGFFAFYGPFAVPGIGEVHDWQMVYFCFGVPGILLAILFITTVKEPVRKGRKTKGSVPIGDIWRFFTRSEARWILMPGLFSASLSSVYFLGVGAWRPVFVERTYGLTPAHYGPIMGMVSLITLPIGLGLGTLLAEWMAKRWDDGHLRLVFLVELIAIPIGIASPLMPTFTLMIALQFVAGIILLMMAPARQTAQLIITPNEMRSQVNAIYMFTVGVLGQGLGPTVVALITDYGFHDEGNIRYAMVTIAAVAMPVAAICTFIALKPYGRLHRAAVETDPDQ
jgi:MFS family permease